jgi:hypothetical protein
VDLTGHLKILIVAVLAFPAVLAPSIVEGAVPGNSAFERTWNRTDRPVIEQRVSRTWMWGPEPLTGPMMEMTAERPGTGREVQYFDKSRMEISLDPTVSRYSIWYVTNGLLARELVTGQMQTGDSSFETRAPASVNVAGDWDDPTGPTYATFGSLLGAAASEPGSAVISRLARDGTVTDDPVLAGRGVTATAFVQETGHTVASPFWSFMTASGLVQESGPPRTGQLFPNPFYATGFPITEAYWASVKVADNYTEVLVQVFERRVLTYTPDNPSGWQVEAGNVGRHYFEWRYGISPPDAVSQPSGGYAPLGPSPLASPQDADGGSRLVLANQGDTPLTIRLAGPETVEVTLDACLDCPPPDSVPAACHPGAISQTLELASGSYSISVNRPGAIQPLGGVWTLLPDARYAACFFAFR